MKFKASKKELREGYYRIIGVGYCNAQHLLQYQNPNSYCVRAEGWACDNYDVNGVLISTGYSYINSKNTLHDYAMIREYDEKAREIVNDYNMKWEEKKVQVDNLLNEFISKCIK